jgi:hypothetical protein
VGKRLSNGRAKATVSPTSALVLSGEDDLSGWDDEEIRRGQKRAKDGTFRGAPPKLVPQVIHSERHRRTLTRAHELFTDNVVTAVAVLVDVATDVAAPHGDRVKAAAIIVERVLGKNPQAIEVAVREPRFMSAIASAIISIDSDEDEDDIIDAEIIE